MIRISIAEAGKSPQLMTFNASAITLGRAQTHELPLTGKGISGTHCRIVREGDAYFIEDLGSTNGTYVNRQKVQGRRPIGPQDDVVLAVYRLRVLGDNESGSSPVVGGAYSTGGAYPPSGGYPPSAGYPGAVQAPMMATPGVPMSSPTAHVPPPAGAPLAGPSVHPSMPSMMPSTPSVHPSTPSVHPSTPSLPGSTPSVQPSGPSLPPGSTPSLPGSLPQGLSTTGAGGGSGGSDMAWEREWQQIDKLSQAWVAAGRSGAALLRGDKLAHARQWLAQGRGKYPAPKPIHQEFIMAGVRAGRGRVLGVMAVVVLVLGGLGAGAWFAFGAEATTEDDGTGAVAVADVGEGADEPDGSRKGDRAGSDELAAKAEGMLDVDPVVAALLATEAVGWLPKGEAVVDTPAYRTLAAALRRMPGRPLRGHSGSIEAVSLSGDGRWAVTSEGGREGIVRLWDLDQAGVLAPSNLRGHANAVTGMEISRDGRWLITADADGVAYRWSLDDADPSSSGVRLDGHRAPIGAMDLSGDGRWMVTGDDSGRVNVWKLDQPLPGPIRLPKGPEAKITGVAINGNGTRVLASSEDMTVRNWKLDEGRAARPVVVPHGDEEVPLLATAVGLTDNDTYALSGASNGTVFLWSPTSKAPARKWVPLEVHKKAVSHIEVSADHSVAVAAGDEKKLVAWDLTAKEVPSSAIELLGHNERILQLSLFSAPASIPAGRRPPLTAFSASADGTARSWNLEKRFAGIESRVFSGHSGGVRSVAVSGDGQWVITGGQGGLARVWDWQSLPLAGEELPSGLPAVGSASVVARGHANSVVSVAVDDFGRHMITGSADGTARVWDLRNPVRAHGLPLQDLHQASVRATAVSPDPRWGASGDDAGRLVLWKIADEEPRGRLLEGHSGEIGALAFTPDGGRLISASTDRTARIWRIDKGDEIEATAIVLPHADEVTGLAISGDGDLLLTGTLTEAVLWKLSAIDPDKPMRRFRKHESDVTAVALGSRGRWAATGSADQRGILYDLSKKRPTEYVLRGHTDTVRVLAFQPSGKWLATGSDDKSIRLWNLQSDHPDEGSSVLSNHDGGITDLSWSPDGRWLISTSNDGTIRLWDTRKELVEMIEGVVSLVGHGTVVRRVAVVPGEGSIRRLVSAGYDGTARVWPFEIDALVKLGCTRAGRRLTEEEWKSFVGGTYDTACR